MESDDLIRRSDAKAAMINLVLHVLKPNVIGPWERSIEESLDSVPAAGAGRPPMLRATPSWDGRFRWWHRCDWIKQPNDLWRSIEKFTASEWSSNLTVDRTASDPAALALYDADLTSRPDAAKE